MKKVNQDALYSIVKAFRVMLCFLLFMMGIDKPMAQTNPGVHISGAGASFPAPLIAAMAEQYGMLSNGRVTVHYESVGSGKGIQQFMEQSVMFGMSEAYLSDEKSLAVKEASGSQAFNLPITLADVVPTYNLPGIRNGMVFNSDILVDIYRGIITMWNDDRILALNPDMKASSLPITVVHRSDGSGTTNIWTSYFSKVSDEWADLVGMGTSVNWPVGIGGQGNEGVAEIVLNTPGAIGYNSLAYALLNNISYGFVINSSGHVIEPSFVATTAAADIDLPDDTRISFTNTSSPNGYPIAGFTWMLVYEHLDKNKALTNQVQAEELVRFLIWCMTDGQDLAEMLGYARLSEAATDKNWQMIKQLKWKGELIGAEILGRH
jgi:phosphate transport system substrate-binding protein